MMKFLVVSVCILLLSCRPLAPIEQTKDAALISIESVDEDVLAYNQKLHPFSNPANPDTFKIKLVGDSVQTATATLEIISSEGTKLYDETFEAIYLLNYDLPLDATEAQKKEFILGRISDFFAEENFKSPAIKQDMTFDPNYSDRKIWNEIKRDNAAIGFYYLLGEEDGRWIAYSKSLKKVVLYFNCC